jgi:hypothetical protein
VVTAVHPDKLGNVNGAPLFLTEKLTIITSPATTPVGLLMSSVFEPLVAVVALPRWRMVGVEVGVGVGVDVAVAVAVGVDVAVAVAVGVGVNVAVAVAVGVGVGAVPGIVKYQLAWPESPPVLFWSPSCTMK